MFSLFFLVFLSPSVEYKLLLCTILLFFKILALMISVKPFRCYPISTKAIISKLAASFCLKQNIFLSKETIHFIHMHSFEFQEFQFSAFIYTFPELKERHNYQNGRAPLLLCLLKCFSNKNNFSWIFLSGLLFVTYHRHTDLNFIPVFFKNF